jgi:dUTP pyrophosphatase
MKVKIKKMHPDSKIPEYAKPGDAGMDLTAVSIISENEYQIVYDTGIAVEIPEGFVGLVFPRSSIRKTDLALSNSVGVIDSSYRGSIQATFVKINQPNHIRSTDYAIGDRIVQLMIIPHPFVQFEEVSELSNTERGTGGHGSTGA